MWDVVMGVGVFGIGIFRVTRKILCRPVWADSGLVLEPLWKHDLALSQRHARGSGHPEKPVITGLFASVMLRVAFRACNALRAFVPPARER